MLHSNIDLQSLSPLHVPNLKIDNQITLHVQLAAHTYFISGMGCKITISSGLFNIIPGVPKKNWPKIEIL